MKKKIIPIVLSLLLLLSGVGAHAFAQGELGAPETPDFTDAPAFARNSEVLGSKRNDIAALVHYLLPSRDVQSDDLVIAVLASRITAGIEDDYDRAMAIHDWVCENIWYDYDVYEQRVPFYIMDAKSVLHLGRGVCAGYANLTAALLRASDIPAKVVSGYAWYAGDPNEPGVLADKSTNHAWNEAFANGRWIMIDTTWDSGNDWRYGKKEKSNGLRGYEYFDISLEAFSSNHALEPYSETHIKTLSAYATPFRGSVYAKGRFFSPAAYTIGGYNYVKLRDLAVILRHVGKGVDVTWDETEKTIYIVNGEIEANIEEPEPKPATGAAKNGVIPSFRVSLNGELVLLPAISIDGSTYFRLRDIGRALGFETDWDAANRCISISAGTVESENSIL
jgi:transglutaminase-like putative cysteine protease